jgi:outer membrane receptor protein involved in Fe transport
MSPRRLSRLALALCLAVTPIVASGAAAGASGNADEADLQFQLGAEHYQKGEFREALEHFLASNRLVPNKNVVFNIARTYEQMKRFADAHRYYSDALEEETNAQRVQAIKEAIARIGPNVAVLKVESDPPGATVFIDRKDLGSRGKAPRALALAPGKYKVIAEIDGYESATAEVVEAKLGAETRVPLKLTRIVGTLQVAIEGAPAATVHVDDEKAAPACTAPCQIELPPGRHLIYFTREGFQSAPRQVNIVAKETARTTGNLSPLTGAVVVSADERDAVVEIDGRAMGFTPAVIQNVAVGKRRVRVLARGFAPLELEIEVKTNEQTELRELKLIPLRQVAAVSRYSESIDDAPSSVSIIDRQELAAFGYPTIAEALRGTRGFYLSNDRSYFSSGVRGLGEPNDYGNRLLVLSDGASLNDDVLNSSYIGSDARDDLHDVSRIEVVRGPGSLLYGTGALSGVVNLVPRDKDEPSGVHASMGTYDNGVVRGRVGAQYNFTPKAGIWASATAARSEGVDVAVPLVDPVNGQSKQTAHNVDYFRAWGTAGRAWWGPLTAQWFFHTREQHIPIGAYQTTLDDPRTAYGDSRFLAEIRFEPKIGETVEIYTRAHANRYTFHGTYSYDAPPDTPQVEDYRGTWFGGEARVAWSPISQIRITGGGEAQFHPQVEMVGKAGTGGNGESYLDVNAPYNFGAGYLLADAKPASWFRASAGARVDVYSGLKPIVVPRAALIFKPWTGGVLKLMGGRAFRKPSVYEQFYRDGETQDPGNDPKAKRALGPESIWQSEVELSQRFLEDWVALVAGHGSYIESLINTRELPTGNIAYTNSPYAALAMGVDVEIRREWRQGWMVSAWYSYERARYLAVKSDDPELGKDPRVINAPEHLAAVKGVVPVVPDLLSLAVRATLEAPRRIGFDSSQLTPGAVIADVAISGRLRKYGIGYVFGVYNFMDTRYAYPVSDKFLSRTMPQNGRTFLGDITVTYP